MSALRARTPAALRRILQAVDSVFYGGQLAADGVTIVWRRWKSDPDQFLFGQYDPELKRIEINHRLAEPDVPHYVVMSVVYHEAIHHVVSHDHCERFRAAEMKNPHFAAYEAWCEAFVT